MKSTGGLLENLTGSFRQVFRSPACWGLVVLIGIIHCGVEWMGGPNQMPMSAWYLQFGLSREGFLEGGVWSLLTYGLLHGSWGHVAMNALFVLLVGSRIEHVSGAAVMGKTVLLGVLGGGVSHLLLAPGNGSAHILVGLSGGCLALLLLLTTLSPESRMLPLPVSGRSLGLGLILASLLLTLANLALAIREFSDWGKFLVGHGFGNLFKMGHACHLGGALAGWLYGRWLLRPRITLKRLRAERLRREATGKP
jgi:membrane associated rhomboid family serine protease